MDRPVGNGNKMHRSLEEALKQKYIRNMAFNIQVTTYNIVIMMFDIVLLLRRSTAFLIGPAEQLRKMFDPVRVYATAVYLGCAVLALICAILVGLNFTNILLLCVRWFASMFVPC